MSWSKGILGWSLVGFCVLLFHNDVYLSWNNGILGGSLVGLSVLEFHNDIHWLVFVFYNFINDINREMTETVAAATGQDNPGAVSEHDVNALAAHQVKCMIF